MPYYEGDYLEIGLDARITIDFNSVNASVRYGSKKQKGEIDSTFEKRIESTVRKKLTNLFNEMKQLID